MTWHPPSKIEMPTVFNFSQVFVWFSSIKDSTMNIHSKLKVIIIIIIIIKVIIIIIIIIIKLLVVKLLKLL